MKISMLGIDLAKNVFQLHGVEHRGKAVLKRRIARGHFRVCSQFAAVHHCHGSLWWH